MNQQYSILSIITFKERAITPEILMVASFIFFIVMFILKRKRLLYFKENGFFFTSKRYISTIVCLFVAVPVTNNFLLIGLFHLYLKGGYDFKYFLFFIITLVYDFYLIGITLNDKDVAYVNFLFFKIKFSIIKSIYYYSRIIYYSFCIFSTLITLPFNGLYAYAYISSSSFFGGGVMNNNPWEISEPKQTIRELKIYSVNERELINNHDVKTVITKDRFCILQKVCYVDFSKALDNIDLSKPNYLSNNDTVALDGRIEAQYQTPPNNLYLIFNKTKNEFWIVQNDYKKILKAGYAYAANNCFEYQLNSTKIITKFKD